MKYLYGFAAAAVVMVVLDAIWLKFVLGPIFKTQLGELLLDSPRMTAAALFYVLYAIGIVVLVVVPSSQSVWTNTLYVGAFFGLVAYGTYELSNMATLKPWAWKLVAIDMAWGTLATALSAVAGRWAFLAAR